MNVEDYQKMLPGLPTAPGVYRFIDDTETILYVGKAKNLKKRIASYFGDKKHRAYKTRVMVKNADHLEFTVVDTEQDALLLENTLIKKHQPRYNVQLKDGKSYPYICVKNERFPRVFMTRKVIKDGSKYFGPYTSVRRVTIVLELIRQLFQLRTCSYNLSEENIKKGKFKVCLEYHIGNCKGPCEDMEEEEPYNEKIRQIKNMLSGKFTTVIRHLKKDMEALAINLEFEKAQKLKEKIDVLTDYQGKSTVVNPSIRNADVYSITMHEKQAYVNYINVVDGALIHSFTVEMTPNLDDEEEDLLLYAIKDLQEKFQSNPEEIILPFDIPLLMEEGVKKVIPKVGDRKKLLELSEKNLYYYKLQKQKEAISRIRKQTPAERILRQMKEDLQMEEIPLHIECFDNSNIQGSNPVASCVVFRNAKPFKKDYRHFKIKTVVGPDDFASMTEVVHRRYRRLIDEGKELPQLIVIDGGKGQLSAAVQSLVELGIENQVTIVGIAKRLEEIYFPDDPVPLLLNKRSETLKVIQQIRNEAHRFAITFHRNQRSKDFAKSELTNIPGIGQKTSEKLLHHFKSVKQLKGALPSEIMEVVGKAATEKILKYFEAQEKEDPDQG
ncbi:MAG: excinuclease ABC subunit UvrC [Bacteroidota bacterium]